MAAPLLQTKLFIPVPRTNLVIRSRLEERLYYALEQNFKIVLLSASAGCGKTTLLAGWISKLSCKVAWLSIDSEDNDPVRFWRYLVAALTSASGQLADTLKEFLQSAQLPPPAQLIPFLVNAIAELSDKNRLILVFDDYHLITNQEIHTDVAFLLDHLSPQLLVILSTRQDPPLPINRIRAKGQLVELRANELRFDIQEAMLLVQSIARLDLQPDEIKTLENRTEGWAVGLQMAALSLYGRNDRAEFLTHFSGNHSFILDYLTEEVFNSQPEAVRSFLLRTSILDQMNASLCAALLQETQAAQFGQEPSAMGASATATAVAQRMLEALEQANLFVVPLDRSRGWYRYHHLFADLLRARLKQVYPVEVALLHHKASGWYQRNGFPSRAVHHALACGDSEMAAHLALDHWKPMAWGGEINTVLAWFEALPYSLIQNNALLGAAYAWVLNLKGRFQDMSAVLDEVENALAEPAPTGKDADWLAARMSIGPLRVACAVRQGNYAAARNYAEQALELAPEEEAQERGVAFFSLGTANRAVGDLPAARQAFACAIPLLRKSGNQTAANAAAYALVSIALVEGDLFTAEKIAVDAVAWMDTVHPQPSAALTFTALGEVRFMQNRLDESSDWLERAFRLSGQGGYIEGIRASAVALARLMRARGNPARAGAILEDAALLLKGIRAFEPGIEIAAALARVQASTGDLRPAGHWADSFLHQPPLLAVIPMETASLAAARVRMLEGRFGEALELIRKVSDQAALGKRTLPLLEALVMEALILQSKNDPRANEIFQKAILLATPGKLARAFLDEGNTVSALLKTCREKLRDDEPAYFFIQFLLDTQEPTVEEPIPAASPQNIGLAEMLTSREMEILKFLCQGWSNREIGEHLFISLPTVKKHTGNIFGKLEVTSRTQAIARARELGLA